jgi:dipeptidyl aminopeptidase/acylaminoacyl peptidase
MGGEAILLTEGGIQLNASEPCWSPDGTQLAFRATRSANSDEYYSIGIYNANTHQINWINDESGDNNSPVWCANGDQIAYITNKGAANSLVVQKNNHPTGFQNTTLRTLQGSERSFRVEDGFHSFPRFTPDGQNIIMLFDSPLQPPDLWQISLGNGFSQPLTNSMPDDVEKDELIMPEEIFYPGENEEISIPALLYRPRIRSFEDAEGFSGLPAVVNAHGGPNWHYSLSWNPFMAHLASRGWLVLAPNYRGSTGYGRSWQNANYHDMGGCDARDLAAGAIYLTKSGLADPAHIAITGRSHGGFLSAACLTQFPDLWAAGSGIVPFFDWITSHYASRTDLQHWNIQNMGDPIENQLLWYERSPYNFLERVRVPIQIICGGKDPRCPVMDAVAARDKLLALGKQVDFQLYANEGHAFLELKNILDSETRRVNFLADYL